MEDNDNQISVMRDVAIGFVIAAVVLLVITITAIALPW